METSRIQIFGVPMDLGQNRRGVDMGPSAVRYAGLQDRLKRLGFEVVDGGNIQVSQAEQIPDQKRQTAVEGSVHHLAEVSKVCRSIYEHAMSSLQADERVIFIGGDHSVSIGTVAAMADTWGDIGVIWVDAHADMNSPQTSPSGNIHGMSVAALLGDGPESLTHIGEKYPALPAENVAFVGLRDVDAMERIKVAGSHVQAHTMREIDEQGIARIAEHVLDQFTHLEHIHVSLDMDSLDPVIAPGVGTPVPGGLTYREAHLLMEILADSGKVRSMDIVEVNPILGDQNKTAKVSVELAASLFGQSIL